MARRFVEPRAAPIGNTFVDVDDHQISPEAIPRRHSFGDYVPHALAGYPTHDVLPKEPGSAKVKGSKQGAVQRGKAPASNLRRRRTTGSCKVAQDPEGDAAETLESWLSEGRWSLASESTQWIGSEGLVTAGNSLDSCETFVAKTGSAAGPGPFNMPPPVREGWAELEAESQRLAQGAREAYLQRLAARSASLGMATEGTSGLERDARGLPEQHRPTLLTSRPKETAAAGRASRLAAGAAAAAAKLPVLLGARGNRAAQQKAEDAVTGTAAWASLAGAQQPEAPAAAAQAREARSLGASTRAAFMDRQRRVSQRFERCLAAFRV